MDQNSLGNACLLLHSVNIMTKKFLIFLIITSIFCSLRQYKFINLVNYNQDEVDYVGNSFLWTHFKNLDFNQEIWQQSWAYDQPHFRQRSKVT